MKAEFAKAAIETSISEANSNIASIKALPDSALNYANCIEALDNCSKNLDKAWNWLNHLQSVADTPELRKAINEITCN